MAFAPTPEQQAAIDLVSGADNTESVAVRALAGTGKTTTLRMIAEANPEKRFTYLAFNRSIADEAKATMPDNVSASTVHSLAARSVMTRQLWNRLNGTRRMKSSEIADVLGISGPWLGQDNEGGTLELHPYFQAGLTMRAIRRFCQTADQVPGARHVPTVPGLDMPNEYTNNNDLAEWLEQYVRKAWADITDPQGRIRFEHSHYLKMWQLQFPMIDTDVVLFDEAQDANPVMASIVAFQDCRKVYVGDQYQQIYTWTGAVDAMQKIGAEHSATLTNSFRFGPQVAGAGNRILAMLGADVKLAGLGAEGHVAYTIAEQERSNPYQHAGDSHCYLARTNAAVIRRAMQELDAGGRPAVAGGTRDITSFAEAAVALQSGRRTSHPELAAFDSWGAVQRYVDEDELGSDLKLMVTVIDDFGARTIIDKLGRDVKEHQATMVVSTAHKAKGREWDHVTLASDFDKAQGTTEDADTAEEELRLLYVAATRAQSTLDASMVPILG